MVYFCIVEHFSVLYYLGPNSVKFAAAPGDQQVLCNLSLVLVFVPPLSPPPQPPPTLIIVVIATPFVQYLFLLFVPRNLSLLMCAISAANIFSNTSIFAFIASFSIKTFLFSSYRAFIASLVFTASERVTDVDVVDTTYCDHYRETQNSYFNKTREEDSEK